MPRDQTLILLKPDTVQRNLIGETLARFEATGFEIDRIRTVEPSLDQLHQHYDEHVGEDYFPGLLEYMQEARIVACIMTCDNAVSKARELIGDTEPATADDGTIRGDLGDDSYEQADAEDRGLRNLVHASEDVEAAEREIELWFS